MRPFGEFYAQQPKTKVLESDSALCPFKTLAMCFKAFENPITNSPDFWDPKKEEIKSINKHKGIIFVKCQRMPNGNNFKLCTILKA